MNKKIIAIAAIAVLSGLAAVSCGKDVGDDSEVSVALPKVTVTQDEKATTQSGETTKANSKTTAVVVSGSEDKTSKEDGETKNTETTAAEDGETKTDGDTSANTGGDAPQVVETPTEQQTEAPAPAANSAYSFGYGDLLSTSAISALGTPNYKSDPVKGCIPNGAAQITYQYSGVDVISYVLDDGSEYIYDIVVKSSSYSTDNGITVGSSRSDVIAAYGGDGSFYSNGSKELTFSYSGDTVSSFEFYSGF